MRYLGTGPSKSITDSVVFSDQVVYCTSVDKEDFYEETLTKSNRLNEIIESEKGHHPYIRNLIMDLYLSLFKKFPIFLEINEIAEDYIVNLVVMKMLTKTESFSEIRIVTVYDEMTSLMAAESLLDEVKDTIKKVKEEQKEILDEIKDKKEDLQELIKSAGSDLDIESAKKALEEAQEELEKACETTVNRECIDPAKEDLSGLMDMKSSANMWGLGSDPTYQKLSYEEKFDLMKKIKDSSKIKEISKIAGRLKELFFNSGRAVTKKLQTRVDSVEFGNNISKVVSSEFTKLATPQTASRFYRSYKEKKLMQVKYGGRAKLGMGPAVVCIDSSGSMSGIREIWSKAICLALLDICKRQKRDLFVIHFSSGTRESSLKTNFFGKSNAYSSVEMIDMLEYFECGGTEYQPAIQRAMTQINEYPKFKKADIVFITDGQAVVPDGFLKEFKKWKQKKKVSLWGCMVGVPADWSGTGVLDSLSEQVLTFDDDKLTNSGDIVGQRILRSIL